MRTNPLTMSAAAILLAAMASTFALPPIGGASAGGAPQGQKGPKAKGAPPDLEKEILKQIKEAYRAPFEVHQDVLDDLRRSYKPGSNSRETSMIKALQRLYLLTPKQEPAMLQEIRRAIDKPSAENEKRLFDEIVKLPKLPEGTVPASVQLMQAVKTFEKFDQDGNGKLSSAEMSEDLRTRRGRWDADRDGAISPEEYWAYYQDRLRTLSEDVAAGKIDLGLKRGGPVIPLEEDKRPIMYRAGKLPKMLPPWFEKLDTDNDGQISFFEWRKARKDLKEFAAADRNADGLITPEETLRYLAQQEAVTALSAAESTTPKIAEKKGKKKK